MHMLIHRPNSVLTPYDREIILALSDGTDPVELHEGIYEVSHFNFDSYLPTDLNGWEQYPHLPDGNCAYGVCDSLEQFLATDLGKFIHDDRRQFVVAFTKIRRSEESSKCGWRWHKWGPYIGLHNPQHEYLFDETDIDEVYCFSVYEHIGTVFDDVAS